jgi:hypothetical protein
LEVEGGRAMSTRLRNPYWPVKDAGDPFWTGFINGWIKGCIAGLPFLVIALVSRYG